MQIAHGYAKASGKPMVAILHNLVGLLHANMAIYYAYIDRAPVFIVGATGPMDETKRRPRIDWIHTAQDQGDADARLHQVGLPAAHGRRRARVVRARLRGDDDGAARARSTCATTRGCRSRSSITTSRCRRAGGAKVPTRIAADPKALEQAADLIAARSEAGDHRRVRRPRARRVPRARQAGRDRRHPCLRRRQPPELSVAPSAQHEPREGRVPRRGSGPLSRHARLGAADDRAGERDAGGHVGRAEGARSGSTSASATSSSRAGRSITSGCIHADVRILADTTLAIPALTRAARGAHRTGRDAAARVKTARRRHADEERGRCARSGRARRKRTGTRVRSRCRGWRPRCGTRSRTRTGCSPPGRSSTGRASSGTSTSRIAILADRSARRRSSASRSAWRSRIARPNASSWTCSPTAT